MTRPDWVIARQPPRKQTPPTELLTEPCRKCSVLVDIADVGTGVVQFSTIAYSDHTEGFRWNPNVREWELTYTSTEPNGFLIHVLHECRSTPPQEQGEAA